MNIELSMEDAKALREIAEEGVRGLSKAKRKLEELESCDGAIWAVADRLTESQGVIDRFWSRATAAPSNKTTLPQAGFVSLTVGDDNLSLLLDLLRRGRYVMQESAVPMPGGKRLEMANMLVDDIHLQLRTQRPSMFAEYTKSEKV